MAKPEELKVAIYGAGGGGKLFEKIFRNSSLRTIVFFDSDPRKQGLCINGLPVDLPHNECRYEYDLMIVASTQTYEPEIFNTLKKLGIPTHKLVPRCLLSNSIPHMLSMVKRSPQMDVFVSGMSYHRQSVIPSLSSYNIFNYAQSSLDLYYDYSIAQKILGSTGQKPSAWIIGMTYYSLEYDMSLSAPWTKVFYYKDLFGYHNLSEERKNYYLNDFNSMHIAQRIPTAILDSVHAAEYETLVLNNTKVVDVQKQSNMARQIATIESRKHYPKTVAENKTILDKYVKLLVDHSIQPVFMLVPFPIAYKMNERIASNFFPFLAKLEKKYHCRTLNGMKLDGYGAECYYDAAHLNFQGGQKFTHYFDSFLSKAM